MPVQTRAKESTKTRPSSPASVAGRLRLLQSELADETPELRQQMLADQIERALATLAPSERPAFLKELESMFPTWDSRVDVTTSAGASNTTLRSPTDERELKDPSFLVSRLVELAPKLPDDQRRAVIDRLQSAGLAPSDNPNLPAAPLKLLREHLKLDANSAVSPTRVLEMAALLSQLAISLDQPLWRMWKEIAPRSALRRTGDLPKTLERFVQADEDVPRGQLQQELESLRRLTAALLQAVGQAGKQLAQEFRKLSPAEIESLARIEKKWTEKLEESCWRKYKELSSILDESAIEASIRQNIANYAESFLGNRR